MNPQRRVTEVGIVPIVATPSYEFDAELWMHNGSAAWFFISLPESVADDIEAMQGPSTKGFGSVPVEVTIGATTWSTSLFPDNKRATYLLPIKKAVRTKERLSDGSRARVELRLVER